jgi:DNA-binding response OmpR family regulator
MEADLPERNVLVIEDEDNLLEMLRYNLSKEGYGVYVAEDGDLGLSLARQMQPDMVILDIMLPKLDGFEVCRILRRESDVPILMLTARSEEIDRVVGLELGADDYVVKPFSMRELMARVRAMMRRSYRTSVASTGPAVSRVIRAGDLEMDLTSHVVRLREEALDLKPREFDLLVLLMSNRGKVYTRNEILDRVWGQDYIGDPRTVDVHIRWLREKVEPDPGSPQMIVTIRGVGYRFQL